MSRRKNGTKLCSKPKENQQKFRSENRKQMANWSQGSERGAGLGWDCFGKKKGGNDGKLGE